MIGGDGINDESNKTAPAPTRNTDLTKYSVHVHHPVRHVLARYRRAARLEVCLYAVERQRHDVLAVDDPGKQRRRRKRAWYRRLRLRCSHDDALALLLSFT